MSTLPQNLPYGSPIDPSVLHEFVRYLDKRGINHKDEFAFQRAWGQFVNNTMGGDASMQQYLRVDGLVPDRSDNYKLYQNGPFSWQSEDIISAAIPAGSELQQWLPTVPMGNYKYEVVDHLEWIAPAGWDGQAYSTWLAGLDIADCDYGPSPKWNGFSYQMTYGEFSWKSNTFNRLKDLAIPFDYRRSPKFFLRGPNAGLPLDNDVDFNVAIVAQLAQAHLDYVLNFGSLANNPKMEWDGLDTILTNGYVAARYTTGSTGTASGYANPLIVSGAALADIAALITVIRKMVRTLRNRASKRKLLISSGDMVIRLPLLLWQKIAEHLAVNGQLAGITRTEIPSDAEDRLNSMLANPSWNIDGIPVPVLVDDNMAVVSGNEVTTDVQILTRRLSGINILEQRYVDYSTVKVPAELESEMTTGLGGIMRYGWIEENKKCFFYFVEMAGMVISRSQPNQGVVTSFTFTVDPEDELEASTFTDAYYANFGTPGSIGAGSV